MSMVIAGAIGGGLSVASSVFGFASASKARRRAEREKRKQLAKLAQLEKNRQAIINPYANVKNLSSMAKDLSGMISNPYANLGVATQAAKFEAEQIDLSLANTLDTLRETGASAGGATALAQAALKSKQGISASIEQQEAQNERLKAQGQQEMQQAKMAEAQRQQGIQLSEAERIQNAEVAGKQFVFGATESRQQQQIDRTAGLAGIAQQQAAQAQADQAGAITSGISALGSIAMATGQGYAASKKADTITPPPPTVTVSGSDRRLKENIKNIGISPAGLNIYLFEYKDKKFGNGVFQGVMSDEIPAKAVIKGADGYDRVDYSLIDVEFKKI